MKIKVLLAEDHTFTRQSLAFGLKKSDKITVVAEAENGQHAVKLAEAFKPDIILMDIVMPVVSGIDATKEIKSAFPNIKVLMLTSHKDKDKVLAAFKSGADGYCMKNTKLDQLINIIENVNNGSVWIDNTVACYVLEFLQFSNNYNNDFPLKSSEIPFNLTNRETEILKLIAEGLSNKDISDKLSVSLYTVKNHVSRIIQKLAVDDRTQAAVVAIKENLV